MLAAFVRPTRLELAAGSFLRSSDPSSVGFFGDRSGSLQPREALERAVLRGLLKPPCVVSFSGGRDSSLVLAVAVHVARREGLPLPIPFTREFPMARGTDERVWQELVVNHLGLDDWERACTHDELDLVGSIAQSFLRAHGSLLPAPLYVIGETFKVAAGGSHMGGEGGDDVLGSRRATFARYALSTPRWAGRRREVRVLLSQIGPRRARRPLVERRCRAVPASAWLRPEALSVAVRQLTDDHLEEPLDWRKSLAWYLKRRSVIAYQANRKALALSLGVDHADPLLDPGFVEAFARAGGRFGFSSRTQAMAFLAEDLLPRPVIERTTKAAFNAAYFTSASRRFAERWSGEGVDRDLVDVEALRAEWRKETPAALSFGLLQAAWLADEGA